MVRKSTVCTAQTRSTPALSQPFLYIDLAYVVEASPERGVYRLANSSILQEGVEGWEWSQKPRTYGGSNGDTSVQQAQVLISRGLHSGTRQEGMGNRGRGRRKVKHQLQ